MFGSSFTRSRSLRPCPALALASLLAVVAGCSEQGMLPEPAPRLEIIVDDHGVSHVYGATDADAFYGAGYVMATDRLFHMDQARRRAFGTLSEVHGIGSLEDDKLARLFDWPGWGRRHADKMQAENPETHALIEAWVQGVNARIDEIEAGDAPLPHGFGPQQLDYFPARWELEHVLVQATMTGFGNDLSFDREAFAAIAYELFPEAMNAAEILKPVRPTYTMGAPTSARGSTTEPAPEPVPSMEANTRTEAQWEQLREQMRRNHASLRALRNLRGIGSNNWAVSGEHTATGRPMLAGDPHLGFDVPGIFYALHIDSKSQGGTINAAGFSFVGTPGISVGHTDKVVWTPTTAFADVMDVWTAAMPDADHVMIGGQAVAVQKREEVIIIREQGQPVGEGTMRVFEELDVPGYGVILPSDLVPIQLGDPGDRYLMNWVGFEANAFPSLLDFNRVQNIDEYDVAVDGFGGNFNFVAADAEGITFRVGTRVPDRDISGGQTPWLTMDANDPSTLWTGDHLDLARLPHGRGEAKGYLSTANNDPFGFTADGNPGNDPWYFGGFFAPGWRAGRIDTRLTEMVAQGGVTLQDMQALQSDVHSNLGDDMIPIVEQAWAAVDGDEALAEYRGRDDLDQLVDVLAGWDRQMRRDSSGALVLHVFAFMATRRAIGDDLSLLFLQAMDLQPVFIIKIATMALRGEYAQGDNVLQEGRDAIVLGALADTADLLTERFGGVDPSGYTLADLRVTSFEAATGVGIDRGTFPAMGGESTVNVAADASFFDLQGGVHEQSVSKWGPIFRHTATFDEDGTPRLHYNFPLGNVAEPDSPHYMDMHQAYLDGEYFEMYYARDDVQEHAERSFLLLEDDEPADG